MTTAAEFTARANGMIIDALAAAIIDDESGLLLDELDAFADCLTANAFIRLCAAIDCCPFHRCDIDTCNDDDRDCAARIDTLLTNLTA